MNSAIITSFLQKKYILYKTELFVARMKRIAAMGSIGSPDQTLFV